MSRTFSLINGEAQARIAVTDRGLSYGDGLFETLKVSAGRPLLLARHLDRLRRDARRLGIPVSDKLIKLLELEAKAVSCSGESSSAVLKITLTRGSGGRGYRTDPAAEPTRILSLSAAPNYPEAHYRHGVRVRLCETRLGLNPQLAGIKHLNRLEQVLARREWGDEFDEGVVRDSDNRVIEGTMSNLLLVRDGRLLTPRLDRAGVAGVMRSLVLEQARAHGVEALVCPLTLADLMGAEGLLLTNSLIGCWPVRHFNGVDFAVPARYPQIRAWIAEAEAAG